MTRLWIKFWWKYFFWLSQSSHSSCFLEKETESLEKSAKKWECSRWSILWKVRASSKSTWLMFEDWFMSSLTYNSNPKWRNYSRNESSFVKLLISLNVFERIAFGFEHSLISLFSSNSAFGFYSPCLCCYFIQNWSLLWTIVISLNEKS